MRILPKMEEGEQDEKLHNTDGRSKKRNCNTGDQNCCRKRTHDVEKLMKLVAEGKVAICAQTRIIPALNPEGVGSMLRTKINVNLGVSRDCKDYDIEMQKVMSAVNLGAEAIMDFQPRKYPAIPKKLTMNVLQ